MRSVRRASPRWEEGTPTVHAELRQDGVAGIVLDAARPPAAGRTSAPRRRLVHGSLAGIVLEASSSRSGLLLATSLVLTLGVHAGAALATMASHHDQDAADISAARPAIQVEHVVDLDPPEPPPPPAAPRPAVISSRALERAAARELPAPAPPNDAPPPPPAEAGQILAADEGASQPLDFTGFDISTGNGTRYAGGITASSGTSSRAVRGPVVDRDAESRARAGTSRARAVGRPRQDWDCPWPREAEALSIDEQFVVIRAVVRADGSVSSADVVSDPGYGFGQIALTCAREQRFPPATDDAGRPILATSPPIRVRFTRP